MKLPTGLSQRRAITALAAVVLLLLVAVFVVIGSRRGGGGSPADPNLRRTADSILPLLNHPSNRAPVSDTSVNSFKAWFYDLQPVFLQAVKKVPKGEFIQLVVDDPNTMPPQIPILRTSAHAVVYVDAATTGKVIQSNQPAFDSVTQNGQSIRVYLVALNTPEILRSAGMSGLLEVMTVQ